MLVSILVIVKIVIKTTSRQNLRQKNLSSPEAVEWQQSVCSLIARFLLKKSAISAGLFCKENLEI